MFKTSALTNLALSFVVRQFTKFGKNTDWPTVKKDIDARVRDLVPGEWVDDEAVLLMNAVIDRAAYVLSQSGKLEHILQLAVDGAAGEAFSEFVDLLLDGWLASTPHEVMALAAVEACRKPAAAA